jgi:putative Mn2+ efflux pump MntP
MTEGMPPQQAFATAISIALRLVSIRLLSFLALGMTFGLFCYAMVQASWISFVCAATFAVLIYLPALLSAHRGSSQ